jgi:uncharacterized protein YqgV (UPF0045/DUF77 family)
MPVTLKSKTKVKAAPVEEKVSGTLQEALMNDAADIVDEIAPVLKSIQDLEFAMTPLVTKVEEAKAKLLEIVKVLDPPPNEKVKVVGALATAEVTAEPKKTEITDKDTLVEMFDSIEAGLAIKLANFLLKDVNSYLTPEQVAKVTTTGFSGKRYVKFK